MKFISWNVNGFRACLNKGFGDFFKAEDADFFSIQESKMQQGQAEFVTPNHHQYWYSAEKKGYSGTAIFAKHEPISVRYGLGIEQHDHEGRAITLEYENLYLLNVYTPNSQRELTRLDYRMEWEDALRAYLLELDRQKPVIYCGDLNVAHEEIDLKNPKTNVNNAGFTPQEREKMTALLDAGYIDTFRHFYPDLTGAYTWWSYMFHARENNAGWRIDYFLVSDRIKDRIRSTPIYSQILGSDHCPIGLELE